MQRESSAKNAVKEKSHGMRARKRSQLENDTMQRENKSVLKRARKNGAGSEAGEGREIRGNGIKNCKRLRGSEEKKARSEEWKKAKGRAGNDSVKESCVT